MKPIACGRGTIVAGLLLVMSCAQAETLQELQAKRAQIIGPEVAGGAGFTVHSPQAVEKGGGISCPSAGKAMTEAEYNARRDAYAKPLQAQKDAIRDEKTQLMIKQRPPTALPPEEYRRKIEALNQREKAIMEKWVAEDRKLQDAQRTAQISASGYLSLYVLHAPADPNATIIPLDGLSPTAGYVAALNQALRGFLKVCGDRDRVGVSHVYRDFFPSGVDVQLRYEKPILAYHYRLAGGVLTLVNGKPGNSIATSEVNGGARNLTLAGAQGRMNEALAEDARAHAEYRKDFEVAAKRKPGIVYKLDAYWQQYSQDIGLDAVRRVFDGDLVGQESSIYFRGELSGFAEIYSKRCRSEIPRLRRINIPSSRVVATRTYASGRVENDYESTIIPLDLDARFADFYLAYEKASHAYFMTAVGRSYEESGSAVNWTVGDMPKIIDRAMNLNLWGRFFSQHLCTSATMKQMRDNLLRTARSEQSVQADDVRYAGAEAESDPPSR